MEPLYLKKNAERRLRAGHLWIYSNEIDVNRSPLTNFESGQLITIIAHNNKVLGTGYINSKSLISARLISRDSQTFLNRALIRQRLKTALALRNYLFNKPFYRLVYGESDNLPGLVIDRFGEVIVIQITTAGMERIRADILTAVEEVLNPTAIIWRNDSAMRTLEGLENYVEIATGNLPTQEITIEENGVTFQIPLLTGQKTGWFYDHRMNRARLNSYVNQLRVLDVFSYIGSWGIQAAVAGAKAVSCIDTSQLALEYVKLNATLNAVTERVQTIQGDAFETLKLLRQEQQTFDLIILDPPAFIKRKKDQTEGEQAYWRINQLALQLLTPTGILISASCSLHLTPTVFLDLIQGASLKVNRQLQLLERGHQGPDHPIHPAMPETDYLKAFIFKINNELKE
jgi:23S rRNA (cytosine1962-C5)-methyltransferase